jgi:hypothetical protein
MTSGSAAIGSGRRGPHTIGGATGSFQRQAILNGRRPRGVEGCTTEYDQSPANACPFRYTVSIRFVPAMSVHGRLQPSDRRPRPSAVAHRAAGHRQDAGQKHSIRSQQKESDVECSHHPHRASLATGKGRSRQRWRAEPPPPDRSDSAPNGTLVLRVRSARLILVS